MHSLVWLKQVEGAYVMVDMFMFQVLTGSDFYFEMYSEILDD
jgi:hypothetical protein